MISIFTFLNSLLGTYVVRDKIKITDHSSFMPLGKSRKIKSGIWYALTCLYVSCRVGYHGFTWVSSDIGPAEGLKELGAQSVPPTVCWNGVLRGHFLGIKMHHWNNSQSSLLEDFVSFWSTLWTLCQRDAWKKAKTIKSCQRKPQTKVLFMIHTLMELFVWNRLASGPQGHERNTEIL